MTICLNKVMENEKQKKQEEKSLFISTI